RRGDDADGGGARLDEFFLVNPVRSEAARVTLKPFHLSEFAGLVVKGTIKVNVCVGDNRISPIHPFMLLPQRGFVIPAHGLRRSAIVPSGSDGRYAGLAGRQIPTTLKAALKVVVSFMRLHSQPLTIFDIEIATARLIAEAGWALSVTWPKLIQTYR